MYEGYLWGAARIHIGSCSVYFIYIYDMCNVSILMKSIVFADDTNFFYSGGNLSQVCETVSSELCKLHSWFQVNKLSLNIDKTNFMIFGNKQCEANHVVSINGMNIKRVYVTKCLGVHIDSHLNWGEHINHTNLCCVRLVLPLDVLSAVYMYVIF